MVDPTGKPILQHELRWIARRPFAARGLIYLGVMATHVYCDHAGFTGDNLLNTEQPFFAYSAVATGEDAAAALVDEFRSRFKIKDADLKGRTTYARP